MPVSSISLRAVKTSPSIGDKWRLILYIASAERRERSPAAQLLTLSHSLHEKLGALLLIGATGKMQLKVNRYPISLPHLSRKTLSNKVLTGQSAFCCIIPTRENILLRFLILSQGTKECTCECETITSICGFFSVNTRAYYCICPFLPLF